MTVAEHLCLVGMMGAGKSTVARLTAQRLGWSWIDTDDEVARTSGVPVAELFARHGEAGFRRKEAAALEAALRLEGPLVVSVGGGAVLDPGNREALRAAGTVVWLRARPETLIRRVHDGAGRPLLVGDSPQQREATLRRIDAERRALYAEVADEVVDVDDLPADAVAEHLSRTVAPSALDRPVRP